MLHGNAVVLPHFISFRRAAMTEADRLVCLQITKGLLQKHGAMRVRDTPITEVSSCIYCKVRPGSTCPRFSKYVCDTQMLFLLLRLVSLVSAVVLLWLACDLWLSS